MLQFKNEPLLTVGLLNRPDQMVKVLSYIDTGSQWCLFHNQYAAQLGIPDYKNTRESFPLSGVGGANANMAYFHDLKLLVFKDNKNFKAKNAIEIPTKIGFVDKHFGFGGILGVYGFLDRFCFIGNIPEHYFELKEAF
ncbi:MAG: hypothetical protein HYZ86_02300 [Candidatus Omnitrophica bacterium]|nr:hypothetical protein [Candidatus Omnitrophota bacterium]